MKTLALILTTFLFAVSAHAACNPNKVRGNWVAYLPSQGGGAIYCTIGLNKGGTITAGRCATGIADDFALNLDPTVTGDIRITQSFCEGRSDFTLSNGVTIKAWVSLNRTNDAMTGMFEDNAGNVGTFSAFKR